MATPVSFPQQTGVLAAPPGMAGCDPLPFARILNPPAMVSCWELTDQEIEDLVKTRRLYLWVYGHGHPPVAVVTRP